MLYSRRAARICAVRQRGLCRPAFFSPIRARMANLHNVAHALAGRGYLPDYDQSASDPASIKVSLGGVAHERKLSRWSVQYSCDPEANIDVLRVLKGEAAAC